MGILIIIMTLILGRENANDEANGKRKLNATFDATFFVCGDSQTASDDG
jgi:hypothetical protein